MLEILKKEIRQFFSAPMGYLVLAVYILLSSLYYCTINLGGMLAGLSYVFQFEAVWLLLFLIPMLTMRSLAEERKTRTDQLLLTAPVSTQQIVFAKFAAVMAILLICTLINILFYLTTCLYSSQPLLGEFVCYYAGLLLLGASLAAVDLFISSLTESQLLAAFVSIGVNVFLMVIRSLSLSIQIRPLRFLLELISIYTRFYNDFSKGIFSIPSLIFYLSFTGIFLFFTAQVVEKRRWS